MKQKKMIFLTLIGLLTVALVACSTNSDNNEATQTSDLPRILYTEIFEQEGDAYFVYFWREGCERCAEFESYAVRAFNEGIPIFVVDMNDEHNAPAWYEEGIHAEADYTELPEQNLYPSHYSEIEVVATPTLMLIRDHVVTQTVSGVSRGANLLDELRDESDGAQALTTEDALMFKAEHEELNGQPHPDHPDNIMKDVYIPTNNPFIYVEYDEIIALLEDGTGIIYFGFPICPWCRNLVPVLADAAIEFGVEEILYRNVLDDRNILALQDGVIVETRAGHPGYYQVLEMLGDLVPEYRGLEDESIRRIFVPAVVFVKDGEVISYFQNLPAWQDRVNDENDAATSFDSMNEAEIEELRQIFMNYFEILFGDEVCSIVTPSC